MDKINTLYMSRLRQEKRDATERKVIYLLMFLSFIVCTLLLN